MRDLSRLGATTYPAAEAPESVLVLAHGAGAGQKHPFMTATARGLAARGVDVVTFDFPYVARGRRVPDRAPVLEQSFHQVLACARTWSRAGRLFIGGKSMGGRMATHLGAQRLEGLEGIVVLGYPLHPPGKPDQLRVAHLPEITARVLIVQGERDPFGTPAELEAVMPTMRAQVTLHVVEGGDHSLAVKGQRGGGVHEAVLDVISRWIGQ